MSEMAKDRSAARDCDRGWVRLFLKKRGPRSAPHPIPTFHACTRPHVPCFHISPGWRRRTQSVGGRRTHRRTDRGGAGDLRPTHRRFLSEPGGEAPGARRDQEGLEQTRRLHARLRPLRGRLRAARAAPERAIARGERGVARTLPVSPRPAADAAGSAQFSVGDGCTRADVRVLRCAGLEGRGPALAGDLRGDFENDVGVGECEV